MSVGEMAVPRYGTFDQQAERRGGSRNGVRPPVQRLVVELVIGRQVPEWRCQRTGYRCFVAANPPKRVHARVCRAVVVNRQPIEVRC